jgi:IclR family mhp operon transcriptional activator
MRHEKVVHSIARALNVVEVLNQNSVTSLERLHHKTQLPKATLARILQTLIDAGYARRVSHREGYAVTPNVLRLSAGVRRRDALVDVAGPLLEAFTSEHKWQLSLSIYETGAMVVRATTRSSSPFARDDSYLCRRSPVLATVHGRAYFAFCSAAERNIILKALYDADPRDAQIARNPDAVAAMVNKARQLGYVADWRGRINPYRTMAVPLFDAEPGHSALGAIIISTYRSVLSERETADRYLPPLTELAARIVAELSRQLSNLDL